MNRLTYNLALLYFLLWFCNSVSAQELSTLLKSKLLTQKLYEKSLVSTFYENRNYEPAWLNPTNRLIFLSAIFYASDEGLFPEDYHYSSLQTLEKQSLKNNEHQATIELLFTDAFMHYASHLAYGKVNPSTIYPGEWEVYTRTISLCDILQKALNDNAITAAIDSLRPTHSGYKKLQQELLIYKSLLIKYTPPGIPQEGTIESGMNDPRIKLIRERLRLAENYPTTPLSDSCSYDSVLVIAVKKFQQKYGLVNDGIIGKQTFAALNAPLEKHIQKIIINLERYRWLPKQLGQYYISINIPDFSAEVKASDSLIMQMKTIVGRPERKTPVLNSELRYLIINPTWTVPPTILKEDALPAIKRNIAYLKKNNLSVINKKGEEVNPYALPWYKYNERNFPYQLVQSPGPMNSLGLIKFQFPNNHRVFLHDTNSHGLFAAPYRAFSSGCIRIEHPFELAAYLLTGTNWNTATLNQAIQLKKTQTITIPIQMAIHVLYFTAFLNEYEEIQFRNDIYGWDELLYPYFQSTSEQ